MHATRKTGLFLAFVSLIGLLTACDRTEPVMEIAVADLAYRVVRSAELSTSRPQTEAGLLSIACTDEDKLRVVFKGRLPAPREFVNLGDRDDASLYFSLQDSVTIWMEIVQVGSTQIAHSDPLSNDVLDILIQRLEDRSVQRISLVGLEETSVRLNKTQAYDQAIDLMKNCAGGEPSQHGRSPPKLKS